MVCSEKLFDIVPAVPFYKLLLEQEIDPHTLAPMYQVAIPEYFPIMITCRGCPQRPVRETSRNCVFLNSNRTGVVIATLECVPIPTLNQTH